MKFFGILSLISLIFFLQCAKSVSDAQNGSNANIAKNASVDSRTEPVNQKTSANMDEIFSKQGKKGDIEFQISGRLQKKGKYEGIDYPNDNIVIEYALKNAGAKNYVIYDRGHSSDGGKFVYVEPASGGLVDLSLKAFSEPVGKNCPARFVAVLPQGTLLKPGETIKEKVYVELPLKAKTPFDDCEPAAQIASDVSRVKFCIGFQEVADENVKTDGRGRLSRLPDINRQELICTEPGEIK